MIKFITSDTEPLFFAVQSVRVSTLVGFTQEKTLGDVTVQFRSAFGTKHDAIKIAE